MSVFTIADLHLSGQVNKSMEVFGSRWIGYIDKLEKNWRALIRPEDTVIIPGDISWGMTLDEALPDFLFLESLPGKKLIGKGNHDFWWTTITKMKKYFETHQINSVDFLYNNAYALKDCIVCGTRGWFYDRSFQKTVGEVDYQKIVMRETQRLETGIRAAEQLKNQFPENNLPIYTFLHFPPLFGDFRCEDLVQVLVRHEIRKCYFGHIHGVYHVPSVTVSDGIEFVMVSADYLKFSPILVR